MTLEQASLHMHSSHQIGARQPLGQSHIPHDLTGDNRRKSNASSRFGAMGIPKNPMFCHKSIDGSTILAAERRWSQIIGVWQERTVSQRDLASAVEVACFLGSA
jgi:hypothetical protein